MISILPILIFPLFLAFTIAFVFKKKGFGMFSSLIYTTIILPGSFIIVQLIIFGTVHRLIGVITERLLIVGFIGSVLAQGLFYILEKHANDAKKITKRIVIFLVGISTFVIMSFSIISYFQWDIEVRLALPGKIPLFTFASFKEDQTEGFNGYNSRAYQFDFEDFRTVNDCEITTISEMLKDDFIIRLNLPFKIFDLLEPNEEICVIEHSGRIKERIDDSNFMNGRIIITRKTGVLFISWYYD